MDSALLTAAACTCIPSWLPGMAHWDTSVEGNNHYCHLTTSQVSASSCYLEQPKEMTQAFLC